jgi:hypothetical protein
MDSVVVLLSDGSHDCYASAAAAWPAQQVLLSCKQQKLDDCELMFNHFLTLFA